MNIKYKLKEIVKNVWFVDVDNKFDRAMLFLRVQEFYESDMKDIKGRDFDIIEYMRMYVMRQKKNVFTYPEDWAGYNVPSFAIADCYGNSSEMRDSWNVYDKQMLSIYEHIKIRSQDSDFYLISGNNKKTMLHEIAHGLYFTDDSYREEMDATIKNISKRIKRLLYSELKKMGYTRSVWDDEIQAYLSTDTLKHLYPHIKHRVLEDIFSKIFKKYYKVNKIVNVNKIT